jgi:hypothetical protein
MCIDNKSKDETYGEFVSLTAKLLKKPYPVIHRIFTNEEWPIQKIRDRYFEAVKHSGDMPPDVWWWWKRKMDKLSTEEKNK